MPTPSETLRQQLQLYLVTDASLCAGRSLCDVVLAAVQGGVRCVQLREKTACTRDFLAQAQALVAVLRPHGVPLLINDRVDIALAAGAQGVHLGQSDMPVAAARALLPAGALIGWSVETLDDVARAATLPLDYLGVSPVFASTTKTDTAAPWGLAGLRAARAATSLPLVAIGGLQAENAAAVRAAGADGIAVVSAILAAPDAAQAAAALAAAMVPAASGSAHPLHSFL